MLGDSGKIFVLDRECVIRGTRVFLSGHPDVEGTVLEKRYLATGCCNINPQVVFEDIDTDLLTRYQHGEGFKDNKILFNGWLGVVSGHRTRIHLRSVKDQCDFFVIDDGHYSGRFIKCDQIKLGFSLLWEANWTGDSSNWLTNLFRYYGTYAEVVDVNLEELDVYWTGKAADPNAFSNPSDFSDAPEKTILQEELEDVQYLLGENCYHMAKKSQWMYRSTLNDTPIYKKKWISKWLKVVDWDRWEYPVGDEVTNLENLLDKDLVLEIKHVRSVVDILWDNGSLSTVNSGDVIPVEVGSVWSDMLRLHAGTIVAHRFDNFKNKDKYGILLGIDKEWNATVKWVTPNQKMEKEALSVNVDLSESSVPLYDLFEKTEYDYLLKVCQCPIVYSEGRFKVGVVLGLYTTSGQVCVKLPDGSKQYCWPHELKHYKNDVLFCPNERQWMSWYEHIIPPSGYITVAPESSMAIAEEGTPTDECNCSQVTVELTPKKKLEILDEAPDDNIFYNEIMLPRLRETFFRRTVEREVEEMEELLDGIWLEYYSTRGDIMSTVIAGPKNTIFEDFLLIFDIFLLEDFPTSEPHFNFRSMGVTVFPRHFLKTGGVNLPEETRLTDNEFTLSFILNVLLEIQDFLSMPLELILEKDNSNRVGTKPGDPEELHRFILLSLLDYTIALLKQPPKNWGSLIKTHFSTALPRIIERYKNGNIQLKRATSSTASIKNEKGDLPPVEEFEMVTVPWGEAYAKSIESRVIELQRIIPSLK